jgi:hypothetical protein
MNSRLKLTLLACALGAASVTTAQTSNVSPGSDVLSPSGSVTAPTMPVVVSPPRNDAGGAPIVRSIGDSMDETLSDGSATGATSTSIDNAAPSAGTAPASANGAANPAAGVAPTDSDTSTTGAANAEAGATSRIVDTKAPSEQNSQQAGQRDNSNATPERFGTPPAEGAPNAPAPASSGK